MDAFRTDVIMRFADNLEPFVEHPPRGKLNLKIKKNFGVLVDTLLRIWEENSSEHNDIIVEISELNETVDYIEMLKFVREESRIDSFNSLAHQLKEFLAKNPAERSEQEVADAKKIVENLIPGSQRVCGELLDFVVDRQIQGAKFSPTASPTAGFIGSEFTPTARLPRGKRRRED